MRVLIRLDADPKTGMGHLTRSLSIANQIRSISTGKIEILFLTGRDGFTLKTLASHNFNYFLKKETESEESFLFRAVKEVEAQVLFIDKIFPYPGKLIKKIKGILTVVMFHNICEGSYFSDLFILPTLHSPDDLLTDQRWAKNGVQFYHGNKYIVLNEQILTLDKKAGTKPEVARIVISTGGSDPKGILIKLLNWLCGEDNMGIEITALTGQLFIHQKELDALKSDLPEYIRLKNYSSGLLQGNDLAICTFGLTTYELMYLGVPVLSIGHQLSNALGSRILEDRHKAVIDLGCIDDLSKEKLLFTLHDLLNDKKRLAELSQTGMHLLDGKGACRVAGLILQTFS